ncbi:ubiquitin 3 binding protein But2 C-terminal domain-containing protein [Xylaria longipes]|nr:ubiquitin 3 binding protein But2 C-terminal domain-containing protein [Xylaria longipes]
MLQKSAAFSSLLGGAYALTMRQSGCSFHMRTEGAVSAPVGQYDSGQTRAGPNETPSSFTLNGDTLTDSKSRGCWWTPPAMVLQCDVGQTPESGFSVGCDGTVSYNGQTTFYKCETGADNLTMIYLGPNGSQCGEVTLHADGCYPGDCSGQGTGAGTSPPAASSTASTPSSPGQTGTPGGSCPGELTGAYQYPHLIIPVDSANADSAPGTSYFGEVTSTISSAFNFDIPQSDSGKTCNLVFYFPAQSQLETSSYTFSGSGAVEFIRLSSPVTEGTSYSNLPSVAESYGQETVAPGNGYTLGSFACPAGQSVAFEMKAASGDTSTSLRYFQDYNPCPIGLYITVS